MKKKTKGKKPSKVDIATYNYLKGIPLGQQNLITAIETATLEKNYPGLKS